jgi:hypothetical protein
MGISIAGLSRFFAMQISACTGRPMKHFKHNYRREQLKAEWLSIQEEIFNWRVGSSGGSNWIVVGWPSHG